MNRVNNNIAFFRAREKMSQQELANAIGVSRKTISTVETGRFVPSIRIALQMAAFFKVPVEQLFELTEAE